jgi:hypothetical protein
MEAMWRELHARVSGPTMPPKGSVCITDYARINKITRSSAAGILFRLERAGKVHGEVFRVPATNGMRPVRYFWPAKSRK